MNSRRRVNSTVMCFRLHPTMRFAISLVWFAAFRGIVVACSGPKAPEFVEHNRSIVNTFGIISIPILLSIVALYFIRHRVGLVVTLLGFVIAFLHPMWHYGGGGPDCGQSLAEGSKYWTLALGGILVLQLALWFFRRAKPIAART